MARLVLLLLWLVGVAPTRSQGQVAEADSMLFARTVLMVEMQSTEVTPFRFTGYGIPYIRVDRMLKQTIALGLAVGITDGRTCEYVPPTEPEYCYPRVVRVPITLAWLPGRPPHRLEVAIGPFLGHSTGIAYNGRPEGGLLWALMTRIGYRYQTAGRGLVVTASYSPQWFGNAADPLQWNVGMGYVF